jgi:hypothetical protein
MGGIDMMEDTRQYLEDRFQCPVVFDNSLPSGMMVAFSAPTSPLDEEGYPNVLRGVD